MERTVKQDPDAILWKKVGGGSFHANIGGRVMIIKPNQEFYAREDEIPMGFRDLVVPVDPVAVAKKKTEEEVKVEKEVLSKPKFFLKEKGGNWWDVVNEEGKVINEKSLRKAAAEELVKSLS